MTDKTEPTGADLAQWRQNVAQMTQADLGEALGLGRQAIAKMEADKETPLHLRTRLACAALALGLSDYDMTPELTIDLARVPSKRVRKA